MALLPASLLVLRIWSPCIFMILLLLQAHTSAQQPAGFINIDCGADPDSTPYTNPYTGLLFEADNNYVSTGVIGSVASDVISLTDDLRTLRYFPAHSTPRKNCYVVPVQTDTQYLIRAWFLLDGNFITPPDDSNSIAFQLSVDAAVWTTVQFNKINSSYSFSQSKEAIVWTSKPLVSICLIRTRDTETPFINSLELRPIRATSYLGNYDDPSRSFLALETRQNFGEQYGFSFRFPQDDYDRVWPSFSTLSLKAPLYPDQTMVYVNNGSYQTDYVCSQVMQTAFTYAGEVYLTYHLGPRTALVSSTFYVQMIFAELEVLDEAAGESRKMQVRANFLEPKLPSGYDHFLLDLSRYGGPYVVKEFANIRYVLPDDDVDAPILSFNLTTDPTSTKDPIVNAFEAYFVIPVPDGTSTEDVDALSLISLYLPSIESWEWVGDPCFPVPWDELSCTENRVTTLNLSGKALTGLIPSEISGLTDLTSLDLSNNYFTGPLPTWVANLPLQTLDVSNNSLNGTFPATYITDIYAFRYFGNPQLSCQASGNASCPGSSSPPGSTPSSPPSTPSSPPSTPLSPPSTPSSPGSPASGAPSNSKGKTSIAPIMGGISGGIVVILVSGALLMVCCRPKAAVKIETPPSPLQDVGLVNAGTISHYGGRGKAQPFTLQALREATKDFREEIGEGGFGRVYLGVLPDKQRVAVKVMSGKTRQGFSEFRNEIDLLSTIHHRKLVSLVGYCEEGSELILLYEFMPGGDLRNRLYGGEKARRSPLNWRQRLQIALDAAKGLEYLHHGCNPAIFHRDVKSSNILLNHQLDAKVGDFGLSKLTDGGQSHVMTMVKGTLGYLDPEYNTTGKLTEKSDVYSFGIVLLEILCGHPPIANDGGKFIVDKVRDAVNTGTLVTVVDPALQDDFKHEAWLRYADIALSCVPTSTAARPTMSKVAAELGQTLEMELGSGTNPSSDNCHSGLSQTSADTVDQPSKIFYGDEGPQAR